MRSYRETMSKRAILLLTVGLALAGGTSAYAATRAFYSPPAPMTMRISGSGDTQVQGSNGLSGFLRTTIVYPRGWQIRSRAKPALTFNTKSRCGHVVTFTPALVQATTTDAATRAAQLLPAGPRYLLDSGTINGAAFRVARDVGSATVRGTLVTPLSSRYTPGVPAGQTVYAQISAVGTAKKTVVCHSGVPRSIAGSIANSFAIGSVGGFVAGG